MDVPPLTDDFKEFLRLLGANRVEYLLVGGYAVGLHGYPRATVDLDIWIHATPANANRVLAAVRAFGFDIATLEPRLFVDPRSVVRFGVPPFRIEVMTSIDGVEFEACRARALECDLDGVVVPVISLEDLKTNKRTAGTRTWRIWRTFRSGLQVRLLRASEEPLPPKLRGDLLLRDRPARVLVRLTLRRGLDHMQVVLHVVEAAIVRKPVEKRPNLFLGGH